MTTQATIPLTGASEAPPVTRIRQISRAGRRQGVAMSGQLVAGVGNLVISAVLARVLLPGDYAGFVAFVAGYVLMHTIASSVTAAVALDAGLQQRLFGRALAAGLAVGGLLAATSEAIAPVLGLPVASVVLLGAAAPSATLLALARGRLYGIQHVGGTVATLCVEPVMRGLLGLALVPLVGPVGAAIGVVGAGYAALVTATLAGRRRTEDAVEATHAPARRTRVTPKSTAVTLTFLLVAVVAAQDVIIANRMLGEGAAALIAAIATIGGAAYFATATIPMVLMPAGKAGRGSLAVALVAAGGVSVAAVVTVALIPGDWYAAALGEHYRGVESYVVYYVAAMAALGVAKVLLAQLCIIGQSRLAGWLVGSALVLQLAFLLPARTAGAVVLATGVACGTLLLAVAVSVLVAHPTVAPRRAARRAHGILARASAPGADLLDAPSLPSSTDTGTPATAPAPKPSLSSRMITLWPLWAAIVIGVALRMIVTRSIWVDEAISIQQAQLPFAQMIVTLREDDVHPPLFAVVLWALVHVTGSTSEWVVRLPSLVAGTAFIPVLYAMARDLWDRRTARIAAFVAAVAPVAVWYAQEARMYAIWMLLATLAAWAQLRILRSSNETARSRWQDWALFAVSSVALLYLQWFTVLPLLVQHVIFAAAAVRRRSLRLARDWGLAIVASLAMFAPLVPYLLAQGSSVLAATSASAAPAQTGAAASAVGGDSPDIYAIVANTIWALWGYHADGTMIQLSALWPVVLLACFASLGRLRSKHSLVIVAIAAVPAVILFATGFERRQFFELRYFTSTVPMVLLLLARLTASWGRGPLTKILLPVIMIASLGGGLLDQQINKSNPRTYDFRGAVAWVQSEGDSDDVLLYAPGFLNHELAYYPAGMATISAGSVDLQKGRSGLPPIPQDGRSVFVFASFLTEPAVAAQVGKTLADLKNSGAQQVERYEVANVTVWEFKENRS